METIEPATIDDIPHLADLLAILFAQEADFTPDRDRQVRGLQQILTAPTTGCIFAARSESTVIGMVALLFTVSTAEGEPVCWLEDMIVHPDWRGSGLGSRLLQYAIDYARAHHCARITLLTDQTNAGAIRFYERQGFQQSAMIALRLHL